MAKILSVRTKDFIAGRIRYHMKHIERHGNSRKKVIAIAFSEARAKGLKVPKR
jgi:hypothetical protein